MTPADPVLPPPDDIPAVSAEELVDGEVEPGDHAPRRYPSTVGGLFYLLVLALSLAGIGLVMTGSWRGGVRLVGGAMLFAAAVRLVLSPRNAGMLAVRHRAVDVALLVGLGSALLLLASSIPNQPG